LQTFSPFDALFRFTSKAGDSGRQPVALYRDVVRTDGVSLAHVLQAAPFPPKRLEHWAERCNSSCSDLFGHYRVPSITFPSPPSATTTTLPCLSDPPLPLAWLLHLRHLLFCTPHTHAPLGGQDNGDKWWLLTEGNPPGHCFCSAPLPPGFPSHTQHLPSHTAMAVACLIWDNIFGCCAASPRPHWAWRPDGIRWGRTSAQATPPPPLHTPGDRGRQRVGTDRPRAQAQFAGTTDF